MTILAFHSRKKKINEYATRYPMTPALLRLACLAAYAAAATTAEQLGLTNVRITFADGRSALQNHGTRFRRDISTDETGLHVHFTANETEFDLDLQLMPSAFTDNAADMRDSEPPAYSGEHAVFTIGSDGFVSGTIWENDGILNVKREAGKGVLRAEKHTWNEHTDASCGVHTNSTERSSAHADDHDHNDHTAEGSSGHRQRRAYDQWWGGGACYENDDTATALKMGIAVGYNMWIEVGATDSKVSDYITEVVQTTNVVVSIYKATLPFF